MKRFLIIAGLFLLGVPMNAATVDKNDSTSSALSAGCQNLRFNSNPETFSFGIVLGFVRATYDEYNSHLRSVGAEYKEKRVAYSVGDMAKKACQATLKDRSEERFSFVFRDEVRRLVLQNFKDADTYWEKQKRTKSTKPAKSGIDAFITDDEY